jgi:cutinase
VYGVNYAASSNFLTVSDGVADATNHVNDMIANCPATRLVLGGFSEGAAVVDFLVGAAPSVPAIPGVPGIPGGLPPLPDIPGLPVALPGLDILSGTGPTNPLPPAAVDHVAAVAVFGNPLTRVSGPLNGLAGPYGPKTIDLCHAGDPLCGGGGDWNAHHEYVPGLTDQAAAFVAGLV